MPVMFLQARQSLVRRSALAPDPFHFCCQQIDLWECPDKAADAEITDQALNTALASMGNVLRDAGVSS